MSIFGMRPPWWATLGIGLVATSVISAWVRGQAVKAACKKLGRWPDCYGVNGDLDVPPLSDFAKASFVVGAALLALYVYKRWRG